MQNTIELRIDDDLAQFYATAPEAYRQKIEVAQSHSLWRV